MFILVLYGSQTWSHGEGSIVIDNARDLHIARQILAMESFPLTGPPINGMQVLGPVWYYVLAVILAMFGSVSSVSMAVGAIVSLKIPLAYVFGRLVVGPMFGLLLAAATMLVGVGTYARLGISHPALAEPLLWGCAIIVARIMIHGASPLRMSGVGLTAALALHAHPTAIFPLAVGAVFIAIAIWPLRSLRVPLGAAVCGAVAFCIPFLPLLFASVSLTPLEKGPSSPLTALFEGVRAFFVVFRNLLWAEPLGFFQTYASSREMSGILTVGHSVLLGAALLGALLLLRERADRRKFALILAVSVVVILSIVGARSFAPFYMLFAALPLLGYCIAMAWRKCCGGSPLLLILLLVITVFIELTLHLGIKKSSERGVRLSFVSGDVKDARSERKPELMATVSARTLDEFGHWFCQQRQAVAVHGALAMWLDMSLGIERYLRCPPTGSLALSVGGTEPERLHLVGLPIAAWGQLGLTPTFRFHGMGALPARAVISPLVPLSAPDGSRYPPRLTEMRASEAANFRTQQWKGLSTDVVVFSPLVHPLRPVTTRLSFNGKSVAKVIAYEGVHGYRCMNCETEIGEWRIEVDGSAPETSSITVLAATPR